MNRINILRRRPSARRANSKFQVPTPNLEVQPYFFLWRPSAFKANSKLQLPMGVTQTPLTSLLTLYFTTHEARCTSECTFYYTIFMFSTVNVKMASSYAIQQVYFTKLGSWNKLLTSWFLM